MRSDMTAERDNRAREVVRLARLGWKELPRTGWAGLDDAMAGAMLMALRAGPIEKAFSGLSVAQRQAKALFPIMLLRASGGLPCRISFDGLLPHGLALRMAVHALSDEVAPSWDDLPDLAQLGMPGWDEEGIQAHPPRISAEEVMACPAVADLDPAIVGAAFRPLRASSLGMHAVILACTVLDLCRNMTDMNAETMDLELSGARDGGNRYGDIVGYAWSGVRPLPARPAAGDCGQPMTADDMGKPGAVLNSVSVQFSGGDGEMQPTSVEFSGRVLH